VRSIIAYWEQGTTAHPSDATIGTLDGYVVQLQTVEQLGQNLKGDFILRPEEWTRIPIATWSGGNAEIVLCVPGASIPPSTSISFSVVIYSELMPVRVPMRIWVSDGELCCVER
jgi:hypothetical protein